MSKQADLSLGLLAAWGLVVFVLGWLFARKERRDRAWRQTHVPFKKEDIVYVNSKKDGQQ